jgi:hypothetical protein
MPLIRGRARIDNQGGPVKAIFGLGGPAKLTVKKLII